MAVKAEHEFRTIAFPRNGRLARWYNTICEQNLVATVEVDL